MKIFRRSGFPKVTTGPRVMVARAMVVMAVEVRVVEAQSLTMATIGPLV